MKRLRLLIYTQLYENATKSFVDGVGCVCGPIRKEAIGLLSKGVRADGRFHPQSVATLSFDSKWAREGERERWSGSMGRGRGGTETGIPERGHGRYSFNKNLCVCTILACLRAPHPPHVPSNER